MPLMDRAEQIVLAENHRSPQAPQRRVDSFVQYLRNSFLHFGLIVRIDPLITNPRKLRPSELHCASPKGFESLAERIAFLADLNCLQNASKLELPQCLARVEGSLLVVLQLMIVRFDAANVVALRRVRCLHQRLELAKELRCNRILHHLFLLRR